MSDIKRPSFTQEEALAFHAFPKPGKLEITATKPMATQRDLSLAYSPGVAVPVLAIADNPDLVYDYTSKGNLVAVITNGTAILGLGELGPLAAKPVMEGKAVLFKRFADVDSIDLEIDTTDVEKFIDDSKAELFGSWLGQARAVVNEARTRCIQELGAVTGSEQERAGRVAKLKRQQASLDALAKDFLNSASWGARSSKVFQSSRGVWVCLK